MEHAYNSQSNKGLIVEASSPVFVSVRLLSEDDAQAGLVWYPKEFLQKELILEQEVLQI